MREKPSLNRTTENAVSEKFGDKAYTRSGEIAGACTPEERRADTRTAVRVRSADRVPRLVHRPPIVAVTSTVRSRSSVDMSRICETVPPAHTRASLPSE